MSDPARFPATQAPAPFWRWGLACAALLPFSFNIGYYLHPKQMPFYVAPLDLLVGPLLLLLLYYWLVRRSLKEPLPSAANVFWAAVALASIAWTEQRSLGEWARAAVGQTFLVGLAAVWIFQHLAPDAASLRRIALALGVATGACTLYALYQYLQPEGLPLPTREVGRFHGGGVTNVRLAGWFDFRGQFAAQLALVLPACAAFAVLEKDVAVRVAAGALGVLGLCVCMAGGGVLAAAAGVLAVAGVLWTVRGAREPLAAAGLVAVLLVVLFAVLPRLPRGNPEVLLRTVSLFTPPAEGALPQPTARLRRYQAAVNYLGSENNWIVGAGAGRFQSAINNRYLAPVYPKPGANTDDEAAFDVNAGEPMSYGLIETTAVELGALGLVALGLVFCTWIAAALAAYLRAAPEDACTRALALASFGAGVGALVFAAFGSPLVRGCGGTFAFFMGMALCLNAQAAKGKAPGS